MNLPTALATLIVALAAAGAEAHGMDDCSAVKKPTEAIKPVLVDTMAAGPVFAVLSLPDTMIYPSGARKNGEGVLIQYDVWLFHKGDKPLMLADGELKHAAPLTLPLAGSAAQLKGRNVYVRVTIKNLAEYGVQAKVAIVLTRQGS